MISRLKEHGYLLRIYFRLWLFAISRMRPNREDILLMLFVLKSPFLYLLGVTRELRTPTGVLFTGDRRTIRSFTYGLIKTHFAYLRTLKALLRPAGQFSVVMDVGANVGDFSMAMKGCSRHIVAMEPEEENFAALVANLTMNGIRNVHALKAAAHSCREEVFLGGERSDKHIVSERTGNSIIAMPLDDVAQELGLERIDVLKIDVQGHERAVLFGLRDLLKASMINLLIVEVHRKRGVKASDIISFMHTSRYTLVHTDPYLFDQPHLYFVPEAGLAKNGT